MTYGVCMQGRYGGGIFYGFLVFIHVLNFNQVCLFFSSQMILFWTNF